MAAGFEVAGFDVAAVADAGADLETEASGDAGCEAELPGAGDDEDVLGDGFTEADEDGEVDGDVDGFDGQVDGGRIGGFDEAGGLEDAGGFDGEAGGFVVALGDGVGRVVPGAPPFVGGGEVRSGFWVGPSTEP